MTAVGIFDSIPKTKSLPFYQGQNLDPKKVTDFLGFGRKDTAIAAGIAPASVRFDEKIPTELSDRILEWAAALELVAQYFGGDIEKTSMWFKIPNPLLGNISPKDMIRFGRFKKLLKFIQNALEENKG